MAQERPHVVEGTQLTVTRAQPRPDYSVNTDRIFVKHVPDSATRLDLRAYFNNFGEVTDVYIPKDKATGAQRRFAFVTFRDVRSARAALGAGTHVIHDQEVQFPTHSSISRDGTLQSNYKEPNRLYGIARLYKWQYYFYDYWEETLDTVGASSTGTSVRSVQFYR
ncbi:RNA-binding protein, putative [Perkinsus marinus ATCC 50983]|uniref:RNA-binding protein, putative n=1 Tax=Perkinsus marinus (strain ATCC 50983 / TXsc) TaxID=423536 RepID=C5L300_PERM5|nr:RNA-binding protein, putative [Perkinsus marinus ATCC 50983]EER08887.1 RNA-binding protein, putative [Perkinsus marinus ATCC 50983]|eukprot:XP_002777071.1 RNA-binding protein, putative [Perkinsus marinus ATCC 50983]